MGGSSVVAIEDESTVRHADPGRAKTRTPNDAPRGVDGAPSGTSVRGRAPWSHRGVLVAVRYLEVK
jgi:hypothetical protein